MIDSGLRIESAFIRLKREDLVGAKDAAPFRLEAADPQAVMVFRQQEASQNETGTVRKRLG